MINTMWHREVICLVYKSVSVSSSLRDLLIRIIYLSLVSLNKSESVYIGRNWSWTIYEKEPGCPMVMGCINHNFAEILIGLPVKSFYYHTVQCVCANPKFGI